MDAHVMDSLITGYDHLIETIDPPDPDDRHVLAAAIAGGANVLVTINLKDFPANRLAPFDIEAPTPGHIHPQSSPAAQSRDDRCRSSSPRRPAQTTQIAGSLSRNAPGTGPARNGRATASAPGKDIKGRLGQVALVIIDSTVALARLPPRAAGCC